MFDVGNHRNHLPMPVDSTILPHKVQTTPKSSTSSEPVLTISIPNNCQIIEVAGEIQE